MFKRISQLALSPILVATLFLSGCGGGDATNMNGGSITVNPDKISWKSGFIGPCDGSRMNYHEINISVLDADGRSPGSVSLQVTVDLSSGTYSGPAFKAMTLYDDPNWVGGSTTPPTNEVGGSYSTTTGTDGYKRLIVGVDLTCSFTGNINAYSGNYFGNSEVSVQP